MDEIFAKVAEQMGLSKEFVEKTYRAYWKAVKEHVNSLPLKEDLTDEEFLKLQPNINIPSIGKLYVTLDRYHTTKAVQKKIETRELEKNKNKE